MPGSAGFGRLGHQTLVMDGREQGEKFQRKREGKPYQVLAVFVVGLLDLERDADGSWRLLDRYAPEMGAREGEEP